MVSQPPGALFSQLVLIGANSTASSATSYRRILIGDVNVGRFGQAAQSGRPQVRVRL